MKYHTVVPVQTIGISLIYCVNWNDNVVFLLSIVWTGTTVWYFTYLLCDLVRQCGISLIYCVNWYDNVVFPLSIVWTGTTMSYFSYLLCDLVRQCGISLIYCVNWYDSVVFLLSIVWTSTTMWYFSYLLCELVRQCGISLIYCRELVREKYDIVVPVHTIDKGNTTLSYQFTKLVFLLSIVWTGTTCVFLLSILWTGTTMWYFPYLLCELVRQCRISLIYCVIWYDNEIREIPHCRTSSHNR